jgi:hypothetical protein
MFMVSAGPHWPGVHFLTAGNASAVFAGDPNSVINLLAKRQRQQQQHRQPRSVPRQLWQQPWQQQQQLEQRHRPWQQQQQPQGVLAWRSSPSPVLAAQDAEQAPDQETLEARSQAAAAMDPAGSSAAQRNPAWRAAIDAELLLLRTGAGAGALGADAGSVAVGHCSSGSDLAAASVVPGEPLLQASVLSSSERSLSSALQHQVQHLGRQRDALAGHLEELRASRGHLSPRSLQKAYDEGMER